MVESVLTDDGVPQRVSSGEGNSPLFSLTPTQIEFLRMIAAGLTNNEIAQRRQSSLRAVEKMIARIFEALEVNDELGANPRILAANIFTRTYGYPVREDVM